MPVPYPFPSTFLAAPFPHVFCHATSSVNEARRTSTASVASLIGTSGAAKRKTWTCAAWPTRILQRRTCRAEDPRMTNQRGEGGWSNPYFDGP